VPTLRFPASPPPEREAGQEPLVDIHVSYERGSRPSQGKLSKAVEIYTKNHVYVLDSALRCCEVRKSARGEPLASSPYIGARLVGGHYSNEDTVEMSYPFPRPGSMAVFETMRGKSRVYHHTTAVRRVELHLSIVTVTTRRGVPTWEDIARSTRAE
jgi:hypothetical protein